jgi:putative SOS response-associated peptidase YedK
MCGRYTHKLTWEQIVKLYRLTLPDDPPEALKASYNVAPTDVIASSLADRAAARRPAFRP